MNRKLFFFLLILAAATGMFALWRSTPFGLGLTNDSSYYIEGARNLQAGNGFTRTSGGGEIKAITHFPPFFSAVLALTTTTGADVIPAARSLITLLFGLTIIFSGLCIQWISGSFLFALLGASVLALSDVFLGVFSMALSEPLFLVLMLAGFLGFFAAIVRENGFLLACSGLVMGLGILTRYSGVSMLIGSGIFLLVYNWPKPWKGLLLLAAGAFPPVAAWFVYSALLSESVGNRLVTWHPPSLERLFEAAKNLLTFLAPDGLLAVSPLFGRLLSLLALLVIPGLVIFLLYSLRRINKPRPAGTLSILAPILALQVLTYLAFLVLSLSLFDASTPLDSRILSPSYLALLILFASLLARLWQENKFSPKWLHLASLAVMLFVLTTGVLDGIKVVRQLARDGQGFAHSGWRNAPAVQAVRDLPPYTIYSNKPTAIYLLTGKSAYILPTPTDVVTVRDRPEFDNALNSMKSQVLNGKAVLVIFNLRYSTSSEDIDYYNTITSDLPIYADYDKDMIFGLNR